MKNHQNNESSIPQEDIKETVNIKDTKKSSIVEAAYISEPYEAVQQPNEKGLVPTTNLIEKSKNNKAVENETIVLDKLNSFSAIFNAIEEGFPPESDKKQFNFPHPKHWIGPRYLATWVLPIALLKKVRGITKELYKISTPHQTSDFTVHKAETIYTSTQKALGKTDSMRFFGARFLAIWVLPLGITAIFIQYLLVNPLIN